METTYLARLRFVANGPIVEGEWDVLDTAQHRYTEWVGLYSKDPKVVVWLIEKTEGREHVLRTWTAHGETTQ
ncbi:MULTISPECIES: hypothetical protein [unclassified Streptomyces]|uniref:hypothetical protein n=1 Tax=unclassified Streptomyces TaxID=2593676 RepID=UPI002365E0AF|nr:MULTISPECIES: hypothetical protein [unclassified Streptomyces]MDF3141802.1 hypothetical protein [Streptomyces sp. T21Q-yed]WDF45091.1 hypothetical protein PBV52_51240 [Streptomyces sp. T12]